MSASIKSAFGGIAQLAEHLHGMQGVRGSNPLTSTKMSSFEPRSGNGPGFVLAPSMIQPRNPSSWKAAKGCCMGAWTIEPSTSMAISSNIDWLRLRRTCGEARSGNHTQISLGASSGLSIQQLGSRQCSTRNPQPYFVRSPVGDTNRDRCISSVTYVDGI